MASPDNGTRCTAPEAQTSQEELARDRTALASERTYAAWVRTALALLAGGLGIARFVDDAVPPMLVRTLSALLILLAIASFILAAWRYMSLCLKLKSLDITLIPHQVVIAISAFLVACSGLALMAVWAMTAG